VSGSVGDIAIELGRMRTKLMNTIDSLLLGRVTYQCLPSIGQKGTAAKP